MVAKKKATKKTAARKTRRASSGAGRALRGQSPRGREWDVSQPDITRAASPEVKEPRPYTSRYPIPEEQFRALKAAAPKAKLAKTTAERVKDRGRKAEISTRAAIAPVEPGLEPSAAPMPSGNFAGIPATGWLPPDCTMAVGPSHVLLSVNSSVAIYNKTGVIAVPQRTLTQWFANVVQNMTIFDPKALYDQHAGRWVLLAVAVQNNPRRSFFLLSVSATSNPRGVWRNYALDAMRDGNTMTNNWADFPALGVDNHALYITSNQFAFNGGFQYAKIRVIPKGGPYSGGAAPYFDFVRMRNGNNTLAFTVQPCHTFGAPQVEYLVNTNYPSGNSLTIWEIRNPTTAPALTRRQVTISPYTLAPNAVQKGVGAPLNTGDVRVLHAVFRGDLWTSFTKAHNWGSGANRAAVQWCQVRPAGNAVIQQGVFGSATFDYYYPAACPDNNGNLTLVFSRSGASEFASILYTGRRSTDPLGTLQPSALLKAGVANYVALDSGGRNRWGDYNGVAADPSNARLVWFYSGYASAVNTWGTWVGSAFF
jgi:hypothetical protein